MLQALDGVDGRASPAIQLRILWTQHAVGGLSDRDDDRAAARGSRADDPRLDDPAGDRARSRRPRRSSSRFAELARTDPSPVVRLYLASALQRLPLEKRWEILAGLVGHAEDAADHNLPLMYWYAAEPLAAVDASRAARLASGSPIPLIQEFMARRIGAIGTPESLALLVDELGRAAGSAERASLLTGIEEALRGRRQVAMPAAWPEVFDQLATDPDRQVRSRAMALALTFGDPAARTALRRDPRRRNGAASPRDARPWRPCSR